MPQRVEVGSINVLNVIAGSVGIDGQPIEIHGTIGGLTSVTTIGTIELVRAVNTLGTVQNLLNVGTIDTLRFINSVGTLDTLRAVNTLGTVQNILTLGTVNTVSAVNTLGTLDAVTSIKSGTVNLSAMAGSVTTPSGQVNVLSTSTTILGASATRQYAAIQNVGGTSVYLAFGGVAGTVRGLRVSPSGIYEINQTNLWRGTVTGITAGASGTTSTIITEWG